MTDVDNTSEVHIAYEKASRIYCARMGIDPDLKIPFPHPTGLDVPYSRPQWTMVADDLYDLSQKLVAIKDAGKPEQVTQ